MRSQEGAAFADVESAVKALEASTGGVAGGLWWYHDDAEQIVMHVMRVDRPDGGKTYRPLRQVDGGWQWGDPPGPTSSWAA